MGSSINEGGALFAVNFDVDRGSGSDGGNSIYKTKSRFCELSGILRVPSRAVLSYYPGLLATEASKSCSSRRCCCCSLGRVIFSGRSLSLGGWLVDADFHPHLVAKCLW